MYSNKNGLRSSSGFSVVELLATTLIMGFVATAATGIIIATMGSDRILMNKCDTIDSIRNVQEKLTRVVRMAKCFGDVDGDSIPDPNNPPFNYCTGTLVFPGSGNPLYGNGTKPSAALVPAFSDYPTWADGVKYTSFTCDNRTLVVQIPVFDANGFPVGLTNDTASNTYTDNNALGNVEATAPTNHYHVTKAAMETHIFKVVQPPGANEWVLQHAVIPGYLQPVGTQIGPITIAKGIIGPTDNNGNLVVFQYLYKMDATGTPFNSPTLPLDNPPGKSISDFTGVIMYLEIRRHDVSANVTNADVKPLAFKTEVFLRNNQLATTMGN